jgi:hypothetical protein
MTERRDRLHFWAVIGEYYGFTANFYPWEEVRYRYRYLEQGYTILGTYADLASAQAAVELFFQTGGEDNCRR